MINHWISGIPLFAHHISTVGLPIPTAKLAAGIWQGHPSGCAQLTSKGTTIKKHQSSMESIAKIDLEWFGGRLKSLISQTCLNLGETLPAGPRAVAGPFVIWADVSWGYLRHFPTHSVSPFGYVLDMYMMQCNVMSAWMEGGRQGAREMDAWINEWTNEWMNKWTNERMNQRTNERMNEWINEWLNDWMTEWLNDWMTDWLTEWMNAWSACMYDVSVWCGMMCLSV